MKQNNSINSQITYNHQYIDIPAEIHYFIVYPFPFTSKLSSKPFCITYKHDHLKFIDILHLYLQANKKQTRTSKLLGFTLSKGTRINRLMSIKNLKKQLRTDNIDGIILFTQLFPDQIDLNKGDNKDFINECGLMQYLGKQAQFNQNQYVSFHFLLPNSYYIINIDILPTFNIEDLLIEFEKNLKNNYVIIEPEGQARQIDLMQDVRGYELQKQMKLNLRQIQNMVIDRCMNLDLDINIKVLMNKNNCKFLKKLYKDNNLDITLIKQKIRNNNIERSKIYTISLNQINYLTINQIYQIFFKNQKERQCKFCLRILQFILYPHQKIQKIESQLKKLKNLGDIKLVGFFITQKMIFYNYIPKLVEQKQFNISELNLQQTNTNNFIKKKCQQQSIMAANTRFEELLKLSEGLDGGDHFKIPDELLPILYYTSDIKHIIDINRPAQKLYYSLNKYLRQKNLFQKAFQELKSNWFYRFSSYLLRQLSRLVQKKQRLYRGLTFDIKQQKGSILTFKSFTSTSKSIDVAISFPINQFQKNQDTTLVLLQMNVLSARKIDILSYFKNEQEYLIEPYSQFRVVDVTKSTNIKDKKSGKQYTFIVYQLQQIATRKQMPKAINNYILWIDKRKQQASLIFSKLITQIYYPTILFLLQSTQQLKRWIKERQNIINDTDSKIILITNMVRMEGQIQNYYAGIDAINVVRSSIANIPIAVYVGDKRASEKNIFQKNINRNKLKVMNSYDELSQFVSNYIDVKFKPNDSAASADPQDKKEYNNGHIQSSNSPCEIM